MWKTGKMKLGVMLALFTLVLSAQNFNKAGPVFDTSERLNANSILAINETAAQRPVTIIMGEESRQLVTDAKSIGEVLQEAGIEINENHKVTPAPEEAVSDTIRIVHIEKKRFTEDKNIDFETERITDSDLFYGRQRVVQKGINGLERRIYEVILEDGQEVGNKLIQKDVIREPVKQIVAMGARQTASRGGKNIKFDRVITVTATAYTHTGNRTFTASWPSPGTIAVDPGVIPLGSRLYVEGYGYGTALDTGGAVKGNKIDLFFNTKAEALKWGRRKVEVFILK